MAHPRVQHAACQCMYVAVSCSPPCPSADANARRGSDAESVRSARRNHVVCSWTYYLPVKALSCPAQLEVFFISACGSAQPSAIPSRALFNGQADACHDTDCRLVSEDPIPISDTYEPLVGQPPPMPIATSPRPAVQCSIATDHSTVGTAAVPSRRRHGYSSW